MLALKGSSDYLLDTLDRYNLDMKDVSDYMSDFWRFEVVGGAQLVEVFVSIAYGFSDAKLIVKDVGRGRLGHSNFSVECPERKLIREVVDVITYTSENNGVSSLDAYYIV